MSDQPNKNQTNFNFQCHDDEPTTLTMTRSPFYLYSLLYCPPIYAWLSDDPEQKLLASKLRQLMKISLIYCESMETVKELIKYFGNVVVICSLKFVQDVWSQFGLGLGKNGVQNVFCFREKDEFSMKSFDSLENNNFIKFVQGQNKLIEFLNKIPKQTTTKKLLPNFISLSAEVQQSNILIKTLRAMITQKTNKSQIFCQVQSLAELIGIQIEGTQFQQFKEYILRESAKPNQTVEWYVRDAFLYDLVNNLLRVGRHPADVYCIQPYFKNLFSVIREFCHESVQKSAQNSIYFRGGFMSFKELKYFENNIGDVVQNLGFLSTSKDRQTAQNFSRNVILQIEVNNQQQRDSKFDYGFIYVPQFTNYYNYQEQILFNPLNNFKIMSVELKLQPGKLSVIRLKYGEAARIAKKPEDELSDSEKRVKNLMEYQRNQLHEISFMGDIILTQAQNFEGGLQFWEKYLKLAKTQSDKLTGSFMLGIGLKNSGEFDKSLSYFQACQNLYNLMPSMDILKLASTYDFMSQIYMNMGDYPTALSYLKKSIDIKQELPAQKNKQLVVSNGLFGQICEILGHHRKALACYLECQRNLKKQFSYDHPSLAKTYNNIGAAYLNLGQHEKALSYLLICQQKSMHLLGPNSQLMIHVYTNIGLVYYEKNQHSKALEYFSKSQQIQKKVPNMNQLSVALIYNSFGSVYVQMKEYKTALWYLKKCLQIQESKLAENNPQMLPVLINMGLAQTQTGQFKQAQYYYQRCLNLTKSVPGHHFQGSGSLQQYWNSTSKPDAFNKL